MMSNREPSRRCSAAVAVTILCLFTASQVGCNVRSGSADRQPGGVTERPGDSRGVYKILGTVAMVTDIVAAVAGDRAEVNGLIDAGVDPHLYKPTRSDLQTLMSADVVFYNGLLLEGKLTDPLTRAAAAGKKVYPVTELLDETFLLQLQEFAGHHDPHVWMDPSAWAKTVDVVRDRLIQYDPDGQEVYTRNAASMTQQIQRLDAYAQKVLSSVPERQRILVTAHDAFNYFGRRYGYQVVGIQGLSTESEAGVQDIERLVDLLVDNQVGAVFVESTVSRRNVEALIEGAKARGQEVRIGGELYSDAMGRPGTYRGTYIGMIDHNASTVAAALGGDVPEGGMRGKLP